MLRSTAFLALASSTALAADKACPTGVDNPCPGSSYYCRDNHGCFSSPKYQKACADPLCEPLDGKPHPRPRPAPNQPSPRPAPAPPSKSNTKRWEPPSPGADLLQPVDTKHPGPTDIFTPSKAHYMPPRHISASGKHQTNKFWTNWISGTPTAAQKPVYTMPYSLQFTDADKSWKCAHYASGQNDAWCKSKPRMGNTEHDFFGPGGPCGHCHCCKRSIEIKSELFISHKEPRVKYNKESSPRRGRIAYYISTFTPSYSMGIKEKSSKEHFTVTQEDLLGVHVKVPASEGQVTFPVYRGMPYISGKYEGVTPRIDSPQGFIRSYKKIKTGVFEFTNDEGHPDKLWECHYYDEGESDSWCKRGARIDDKEYGFFGGSGKSPCGQCDCCERPAGAANKEYGRKYRAFVMDTAGKFIDGDFKNTSSGFVFNQKLNGWVRMAHIEAKKDEKTYEKHAPSILLKLSLDVKQDGEFRYRFARTGNTGVEHLHLGWRHQKMLLRNGREIPESQITHIKAPTKGKMVPLLGTEWTLKIDVTKAQRMNLLPEVEPQGSKKQVIIKELEQELKDMHEKRRTWAIIFTNGFYTNGKGLQKLGTLCLMSQRLFGASYKRTSDCAVLLKKAFRCHYDSSQTCSGVPKAHYDQVWGGIASRQGFTTKMCGLADFGNACYNDHHYHYGYFIHAAAQLLQVDPKMRDENDFIAYVNSMIRDIFNPSKADTYFPQFRAFDWYDLHSWSHGVTPSQDGKDEESTSEDVNAYFGIQQWARLVKHKNLEKTAAMALSLLAHSAANLFLMKDNNKVHPADYIRNRVTGIFFEGKVHYGTFFGSDEVYIHGIQMIPLSPAFLLARDKEFCQLEYRDILSKRPLPIPGKHPWSSLLITGNLAFHDPKKAFSLLQGMDAGKMDQGLTKAWALYWTACMDAGMLDSVVV